MRRFIGTSRTAFSRRMGPAGLHPIWRQVYECEPRTDVRLVAYQVKAIEKADKKSRLV